MFKKILYIITIILILLSGYLIYDFWFFRKQQDQMVVKKGKEVSTELVRQVQSILTEVTKNAESLATDLENKSFSKEELEQIITKRSQKLDKILGITVAFEPYAFDPSIALYSPYFDKSRNEMLYVEKSYDYTDNNLKTTKWYVDVIANGARWTEPYFAKAAQELVSDYSMPFYHTDGKNKGKIKGVIAFTISLQEFTRLIHSLSLGKTGLGFVSSKKGTLLAHPVKEYIGRNDLSTLIKSESGDKIKRAYQSLLDGESGSTEFFDEEKQQKSLFFFDTVPISNWGIGILIYKNDILVHDNYYKRKYIHIAIVLSLLLFFILAIFYNRDYLSVTEIWYLSFFASVVLVVNIVLIGYLEYTGNQNNSPLETRPITDMATLSRLIEEQSTVAKELEQDSLRIVPTGIYVESLEFGDSYNLNISGRLWQKYDTAYVKNLVTGFRFPQIAPFAESSFIEESYREPINNYILVGYNFRTTVRLNFAYDHYPFDKRHINLEIQPIDNRKNILLVPDLGSYAYTNPSQRSGIDPDIRLPGSTLLESYFTFKKATYHTDFGFGDSASLRTHTQLNYNITVKRVLITAFITYLIPIFVTLIMMFILIYATEKSKDSQAGGGIVQGMAAFFFVLIFSHIDLRKDILTAELVYMEYFYFIAYVMIVLSTYNLIIYTRMKNKLFDYNNNLIVKTTFWPLFLSLVYLMTLIKFY